MIEHVVLGIGWVVVVWCFLAGALYGADLLLVWWVRRQGILTDFVQFRHWRAHKRLEENDDA